ILRQRDPRVENIRRTETDINVFERKQAAHHQAGTNQQHNRKRDLRNNNARPPSAMNRVASAALSAAGKRSLHVPVYGMKHGSPPSPTLSTLPEVAGPSGDGSRPVKLESQFLSREWCLGPAEGLPHYYRQLAAAASPPPSGKRG